MRGGGVRQSSLLSLERVSSLPTPGAGVYLCVDCAQVHRSIGTHISKVKSCMGTYLWHPDELEHMAAHGNGAAHARVVVDRGTMDGGSIKEAVERKYACSHTLPVAPLRRQPDTLDEAAAAKKRTTPPVAAGEASVQVDKGLRKKLLARAVAGPGAEVGARSQRQAPKQARAQAQAPRDLLFFEPEEEKPTPSSGQSHHRALLGSGDDFFKQFGL